MDALTFKTPKCRFTYRDVGTGPVLLCLQGTGPGATGWGNFGSVAVDLATDFRVIVPDLPGFGGSEMLDEDDEPWCRMAAREVLALMDGLGLTNAHLVGNSAGGTVALHIALRRPPAVKSLVLMGPAGLRMPLFSERELRGAKLLRSYRPNPSLEKMRALIEAFLYDPSILDVEKLARERYEATIRPGGSQGNARIGRGWPESLKVTPDELSRISVPTLLLCGRDDVFVGVDDMMIFAAQIPDSRLCILSRCGHWVQIERRGDFLFQVRGFVSMVEGKNGSLTFSRLNMR